jgi:opacity protein-like surface antigen
MNAASRRSIATLLLSTTLTLLPGAAVAAGVVFIKGGAMRLLDNRQTFEAPLHVSYGVDLDDVSYKTFNIGWEKRFRHGLAVGTEYVGYRNKFTSSAPSATGKADTDVLLVVAKKYFFDSGRFHPYVGGGIGTGVTDVSNTYSGGLIDDTNVAFLLHAVIGMELRVDNLSFVLEAKHLNFAVSNIDVEYNPTATGIFLGAGLNW